MSLFTTPKAANPLSHDLRVMAKRTGNTQKGNGLLLWQAAQTIDALRARIAELEAAAVNAE